jgi:DNA repair exonuclease SbcCD ATPase subunit
MQNKIETLTKDGEKLEAELERSKTILHQRISTAQTEISELKTSALERVTDVEVKITKLDSKIDGYGRDAQAARSEAQATMNAILERLQRDIPR